MACRLFDAKPLPEPMLTYCQWEFGEIWIKIQNFSVIKIQLKTSSAKWQSLDFGLNVLSQCWSVKAPSRWQTISWINSRTADTYRFLQVIATDLIEDWGIVEIYLRFWAGVTWTDRVQTSTMTNQGGLHYLLKPSMPPMTPYWHHEKTWG